MDRRNFLGIMVGGLATAAAVRSFPFRVFSFPKEPSFRFSYAIKGGYWLPHEMAEEMIVKMNDVFVYRSGLVFRNGLALRQGIDYTLLGEMRSLPGPTIHIPLVDGATLKIIPQ